MYVLLMLTLDKLRSTHHQHAGDFEIGKSEIVGIAGDSDRAIGPSVGKAVLCRTGTRLHRIRGAELEFPNGTR